jgi:chromosome partitioning protein
MSAVPAKDDQSLATNAIHELVGAHARELSAKLQAHRLQLFPPTANKTLRRFSSTEAAKLIGVNDGYLRRLSIEGKGPKIEVGHGGRRSYTIEDIHELRNYLAVGGNRQYLPIRSSGERLQVIAVVNFKGGSGKTTTAAHLAQYLALRGYRVLALDLDPQASLSALHGVQPEFDVGENESLYGAIRYDDQRRDLGQIVRKTYFGNLDLVPANLELMEFEHESPRALLTGDEGQELFFTRMDGALASIANQYDVAIIDCPPQLGFLTMSALCAATAILVTVHPQMLDVMSMCQFLLMTSNLLGVVANAGGNMQYDWMRYLITRYEPGDGPQNQMVSFMRSMFGEHVLNFPMLKSTAISDAGITKQTLYEVSREQFTRATYDRAVEALDNVNGEIERLILKSWGRA